MNVLTLKNITKSYNFNEPPALNDLSFNCQSSEVVALIGGSGSGKTTLLRIIAGLEAPDYGEVILNNDTLRSEEHTHSSQTEQSDKISYLAKEQWMIPLG